MPTRGLCNRIKEANTLYDRYGSPWINYSLVINHYKVPISVRVSVLGVEILERRTIVGKLEFRHTINLHAEHRLDLLIGVVEDDDGGACRLRPTRLRPLNATADEIWMWLKVELSVKDMIYAAVEEYYAYADHLRHLWVNDPALPALQRYAVMMQIAGISWFPKDKNTLSGFMIDLGRLHNHKPWEKETMAAFMDLTPSEAVEKIKELGVEIIP